MEDVMDYIAQDSRATVLFTVTWSSGAVRHEEQLWAEPVSFWRDILHPDLVRQLMGNGAGGRAKIRIPADQFAHPYNPSRCIEIRPDQFGGRHSRKNPISLMPGRYYPQGMLHGVAGVFKGAASPCLFLGQEGRFLIFDLNHPLAGHDLDLEAEVMAIHSQKTERGGRCEDWLERVCADGPGMQAPKGMKRSALLSNAPLSRVDEQPDTLFYRQPRLVQHLDSTARAEIGRRYRDLIAPKSQVLDLMGSWDSHLPDDLELGGLTVLGLNEEELRHNRRATATLVHDLNADCRLPIADSSLDAVVCTASVEYLINPLAVMAEIRRALKPGGIAAFAFSNRWFPPKAIRLWADLHEFERLGLVTQLFHATGGFNGITTLSRRGLPRPADDPHGELWLSDPLYMVWGRKNEARSLAR